MPTQNTPPIIHIALVGGDCFCEEILQKITFAYKQDDVNARITAVADSDQLSPGIKLARKLKLQTFSDYHDLYDPRHQINLIIILTPAEEVFSDILATRPPHIRIMSYYVFEIFWQAICVEERKLRKRNQEMDTILNAIQDFILVLTPDMEVIEANDAFMTKMGYSPKEIIGKKCHELFLNSPFPCSEDKQACPLKSVIRTGAPVQQKNALVNRKGELRHFEIKIYPIWEHPGKISKFVYISQDVTQRIQQEEEITGRLEQMVEDRTRQLQETHAKLLHQDKIASLGKLSASVVHEINNPIAGILNLTLLMKRILDEEQPGQKTLEQFMRYLNLMEKETRRTSRIVNSLLAFSRQQKPELKPLDLARLIDKVLLLNSNLLKIHRVKVEKHFKADLPELIGSGDQLQQVFMNIISNAAEAMETTGGGVLRIETRPAKHKKNVEVLFSDTGVGIAQENFTKLFEPFYTSKKKGKGIGLGLSVAYGIIKEHGGFIFVNSTPGEGTTFTIVLPFTPAVPEAT